MNRLVLNLNGDHAGVGLAADRLEEFCVAQRLPDAVVHALQIALDELLSNTVSYGFDGVAEPRIDLTVERTDESTLRLEVSDNGIAFDPREAPEPDIDADIDDRVIGGLGIHLVQQLMDDLAYERRNGCNVVTLIKRLDSDSGVSNPGVDDKDPS